MPRFVRTAALMTALLFVVAIALAAANAQSQPKPTDVAVSNTQDGHVLVSWDDDDAPVHRVGWAHAAEVATARAAGDWLEAFHFADTKRNTDYTIKYLPPDQTYLVIVGAGNQRFGAATWSEWSSLVTAAQISDAACAPDHYDRDDWGDYPDPDPAATPTWTLPSDAVTATDITLDHHVSLLDAHVSGGCNWSDAMKNDFATELDNLNPTTRSFNSSKGSRTPDQLTGIALGIIDTDAEKCDYATQHDAVKYEYDLSMTESEQATVTAWLALCSHEAGP